MTAWPWDERTTPKEFFLQENSSKVMKYQGLEMVISGGQTGADRAGLFAAEALGISTGGWMPRGFLASDGRHPNFAIRFGLREHPSPLYPPRTRENIRMACATLCLEAVVASRGVSLTRELAAKANKPLLRVLFKADSLGDLAPEVAPAAVIEWINGQQIRILNIAGNGENKAPGLQHASLLFLTEALRPWALH